MIEKKYPHLFSPIKIGNLTLKNRIEAAPTSLEDFTEQEVTPRGWIEYHARRAAGGAAIVTIGEVPVITATGPTQHNMLEIDNPDTMPWLNKVADAIHQQGAVASLELSHAGAAACRAFLHGNQAMAPSATHCVFAPDEEVREMTEDDIWEVIHAFGDAAHRLKLCGFDMCLIHAGHGWLIGQFLSPIMNHRTDKWGGNLENRSRFLFEIIKDIRAKAGGDFPIEVRISGSEEDPRGFTLDECIEVCKKLDGVVDLLHISIGAVYGYSPDGGASITSPSYYEKRGRNVYLAEAIKKHVTKTPVLTLGALGLPEEMEEIIASGKADMVAMARALIADPDLPKKALHGKPEDIRPCLRCTGCLDDTMVGPQVIRCAVNPTIGREIEYCLSRREPKEKKSVLVIGGGPAGMQAALTAAERGHKVILCDQNAELGGALLLNKDVPFKVDMNRLRAWYGRMLERAGVDIRLNTKVTPEMVESIQADEVICAIGAEPIVPRIKGVDGKNVMLYTDAHNGKVVNKKVIIVGAGYIGCELATYLSMSKGCDVTCVDMADIVISSENAVIEEWDNTNLREYITVNMEKNNVKTCLGVRVEEIQDNGVVVKHKDGTEELLEAEAVVIATGMRPIADEREALRASCLDFRVVGNANKVGRIKDATASGYAAGYYIGM